MTDNRRDLFARSQQIFAAAKKALSREDYLKFLAEVQTDLGGKKKQ